MDFTSIGHSTENMRLILARNAWVDTLTCTKDIRYFKKMPDLIKL